MRTVVFEATGNVLVPCCFIHVGQWLDLLREMITDGPQRFRHYSGLSVQSLLDLLRDLLDNLSKSSAPLHVDAFVNLDPATASETEWMPTVEVRAHATTHPSAICAAVVARVARWRACRDNVGSCVWTAWLCSQRIVGSCVL